MFEEDSSAEEIELCVAVPGALDELGSCDLALDLAGTPVRPFHLELAGRDSDVGGD